MDVNYDNDEIFNRAIVAFGVENCLNKFREECCEAAVAVDRLMNGRKDALIDLAYEIADVTITMCHAKRVIESMSDSMRNFIGSAIEEKTKKMVKRIEEMEIAANK